MAEMTGPVKIGIGGPVGSGKTALIEKLCRRMSGEFSIAVVTNVHAGRCRVSCEGRGIA